jgi:xanthine dehydrogenase large subunit
MNHIREIMTEPNFSQYREAAHLSGQTRYIPDLDLYQGTLIGYAVTSPYACARLLHLDISRVLLSPGVEAVITAQDIPGPNTMAPIIDDEPCLLPVGGTCGYMGQVVCIIAADTRENAIKAVAEIAWEWDVMSPVLSVEESLEKEDFLFKPLQLKKGDPAEALKNAPFRERGSLEAGGQEHYYFEPQAAYAVPLHQGGLLIRSSTQNPTDNQRFASALLKMKASDIEVQTGCLGGGFGGKQSQATWTVAWSSLLAWKTNKPVIFILDRDQDFRITGKRHGFKATWNVGFDGQGKILAVDISMAYDCGWCNDVSLAVLHHCIFHVDGAYYLPNLNAILYPCRTNKPSNTAFRGFGVPQAISVIESIITQVAQILDKDPVTIRWKNYYGIKKNNLTPCNMLVKNNILRTVHRRIVQKSDYFKLRKEINIFNKSHYYLKRGLAMVTGKFGISFNESFLNQAGALINIYRDGSVLIHHPGTEMGQGLHDKMRTVVHRELGVSTTYIRVSDTSTSVIPNTTSTAASTGSDFGGAALKDACDKLKKRLHPIALDMMGLEKGKLVWENDAVSCKEAGKSIPFPQLAFHSYLILESLSEKGFYKRENIGFNLDTMEGRPYWYYVMGSSVAHVELNLLTGKFRILDVWILHDCGEPIDKGIDLGQIHGAFIQGLGWCTLEKLITDPSGRLLTDSLNNYKIPGIYELPKRFHIELFEENPEPLNIHNSRAIGEPPLVYALSVWFALRDARGIILPIPATSEELIKPLYNEK